MKNYILLFFLLTAVVSTAWSQGNPSTDGNFTAGASGTSNNRNLYLRTYSGTTVSQRLSINFTSGNVGIGTAAGTISERLHVVGSARADRFNSINGFYTSIGSSNLSFNTGSSSTDGTGGTTRMTILNSNGFVGINQLTPSAQLHVGGSALFQYTTAPGTTSVEVDNGGIRGSIESVIGGPVGTVRVGSKTNYTLSLITNSVTRMTVLTDGKIGVGTATPAYPLDVVGTINATQLSGSNLGIGTVTPTQKLHVEAGNILLNNPTPVLYTGTGVIELGRYLRISNSSSADTPSGVKAGGILVADDYGYANPDKNTLIVKGTLAIGTSTNPNAYKLAVNGKIGAKDLQLETTSWPDYVFQDSYELPSLNEVETYIKENGHLKDVPSAEEVKENGYSVNEVNEVLLKKVEELTLYIIEQQKQLDELKKEVSKKKRK